MLWPLFLAAPMVALPAGGAPKQACPQGDEIAFVDAPRCVDQTRRVLGRVDHVERTRSGTTFVNFCADYRGCPFTAVIFAQRAQLFPDIARLAGNDVAITGRVVSYRGKAEIVLDRPEQVLVRAPVERKIVTAPSEPPPTPPKPPEEPPSAAPADAAKVEKTPEPKADPKTLWASEAGAHVGQTALVRGRVGRLDFQGGDLVLTFRRGEEEVPFVAVVLEPHVVRLKDAIEKWDGQAVTVEGEITSYNGHPSIFVTDAAQVRAGESQH